MTHRTPGIRPATTAIAAILAFSSTPLLAQATPDATQPVVQAPAAPVPESAPPAPTLSDPAATSASDPLAAEPKITTKTSSKSVTTRRTATVARPAKAAPRPVRVAAAAPVAAPVAAPAESAAPAPVPVAAVPPAPSPAAPVAATPPAQQAPATSNAMLPIAGIAGLILLGLIAVVVALRRRRLRREEEFAAADQYESAPEAPAPADPLVAREPSAGTAAGPAPAAPFVAAPAPDRLPADCVDAPPGSHVEAACEGPSADNPSLSIRKRIKRAHFFDEREQLAAAGMAVPVAADAGLPDALEAPAEPKNEPA